MNDIQMKNKGQLNTFNLLVSLSLLVIVFILSMVSVPFNVNATEKGKLTINNEVIHDNSKKENHSTYVISDLFLTEKEEKSKQKQAEVENRINEVKTSIFLANTPAIHTSDETVLPQLFVKYDVDETITDIRETKKTNGNQIIIVIVITVSSGLILLLGIFAGRKFHRSSIN